jgi:hypothetical protein
MDDAPLPEPGSLINRERSWLDFACRVVTLAEDPDLPLMERVKFAGIMGMIYDEFAMKRIGGLRQRLARGDAGSRRAAMSSPGTRRGSAGWLSRSCFPNSRRLEHHCSLSRNSKPGRETPCAVVFATPSSRP